MKSPLPVALLARTSRVSAALNPPPVKNALDAAAEMEESMSDYGMQDVKLKTAAAVQEWLSTSEGDLDDGESMADRLFALMVGIADADQNGELDEDEEAVLNAALNAAYDYLESKGVAAEDIDGLLNEADADAAGRVIEMLQGVAEEDPESLDDSDEFAFGADAMDAVYKKTMAVRNGKKVKINKRVSGTVRLTAKQKMAIRKAQKKAHSATAMRKRMKSAKVARTIAK